jgi:CheY-like chemotaxis protein
MRVLVIEDEFLVAAAIETVLQAMGHDVLGPVATVEAAIATLGKDAIPDVAIVDLNLRGKASAPVAEELSRLNIPFVFATGYEVDKDLKQRFPAAHWLRKPYTDRQISASLAALAHAGDGETVSRTAASNRLLS